MEQAVSDNLWQPRAAMTVQTAFAAFAAALSALGIYGVMSYIAAGRRQEIGIRMAVGPRRADVIRMMVGRAMRPVAAGACAGIMIAAGLIRVMAALLFGVKPNDPSFSAGLQCCSSVSPDPPLFYPRAARRQWIQRSRCARTKLTIS